MLFLGSSALNSIKFTNLEADSAADAGFLIDLGNSPLEFGLVFHDDAVLRAFGYTCTTLGTFVIIDMCQVVFNLDRVVSTNLNAETTADTANFTGFSGVGTLLGRIAFDVDHLFLVDHFNQLLWTGEDTFAASDAFFFIDYRQMIGADFDCIEGTGSFT